MGGLECPFFNPLLFWIPLFYVLHTCSVSEAHFVIWNICGTLLWRRPTLLLLLLPVFISHRFADGARVASVVPALCSRNSVMLWTGTEVLLAHNMMATSIYMKIRTQVFVCAILQAPIFIFLKKYMWVYMSAERVTCLQRKYILIKTKGPPTWGSCKVWLLSRHNISYFLAKWKLTWIDLF